MKRSGLIALVLVAPLAAMAQYVVFTDNFNNGSTTNHTSVPGGTPFNSFTSYDVAATKAATTNVTITPGDFKIALNSSTSSGLLEVQALFSTAPITLVNAGDYINLTYTFRITNALPASSAYIAQGLFNSGGVPPVAGSLNNSGLAGNSGSPFATGNCAGWQGYFSRIFSNAASGAFTRPIQNAGGTTSANQDLVGNGVTGGFNNPAPATVDTTETASPTLTPGAYYTISYTIAMTDPTGPTLTISNFLYSGAGTGGSLLFSQTNVATGTNYLTNSFDGMAFGRREGGSVLITMDITNITISENILGLPGQPFDVTGGGIGCPGATFPVGLDGSVTTNDYYLYTNGVWTGILQTGTGSALVFPAQTVVAVPLTNTVIASNTMSAFTGQMIGSAIVAPNAPPSITNQPIPVIVANGSIGVFSVGATGGGLTYQWFKNGSPLSNGGNIMGATNSTLAISPVGAGDAANYFCGITSGCNVSLDSTTNSLTIAGAASITWQGNNNSNWDLSTTANFINSSSTAVVFHNGDNVTLDDSSTTQNINVNGNFIAPGTMTENAFDTYIISGSGVIQGPGSLTMNGGGTLSINNSNAWTGGTIVKGGILILSNLFSVGTGNITLSGGTLDIPFKVGSAVGTSNNINVTGDSTLKYDQNGTFACVLNGQLTGSSSATLTVFAADSADATARVRLYGYFTNNANIVLQASASLDGSDIEFAPYNDTNGSQVYNGVISGGGGHIVPRGTGSVILNGANTFNDTTGTTNPTSVSLLNSSGNVGIGADSVQSSPPTIDSSPVGVGYLAVNTGSEGGSCSFFASGGAHTIANQFIYTSASNTVTVTFGGTNNLTFAGEFDLANPNNGANSTSPTDSNGTNRTLNVTNTAATTFSGFISDNGNTSGFTKNGNGALYLNGTNIYTGPTTNNAGLLAGTGYIGGPVIIGTNGTIGGGSAASIGTLTLSNNLTLNGNVSVRVNKSLSPGQSNDVISVMGSLANTGTGTVTVNNLGPSLAVGDRFQIFNQLVTGGGSLTITGSGVTWNNNLGSDGSISVQSTGPSGPTTNATITKVSLSGTNILIHGTNNNIPNTSFHFDVFTSTNVALPLSSWTPVATGLPFNPDGTFDYTNPIVPGTPRQFIDVKAVP